MHTASSVFGNRSVPARPLVNSPARIGMRLAIANYLQQAMDEIGMDQKSFAPAIGTTEATLSRALNVKEGSKAKPHFELALQAARLSTKPLPPEITQAAPRQPIPTGMGEREAVQYIGPKTTERVFTPNQTVWTVNTHLLTPLGIIRGQRFILDQSLMKPKDRDIVIANVWNRARNDADTLLRMFFDGYLVTPNFLIDRTPRIPVDEDDERGLVVIMGTAIEFWPAPRG